MSLFNLIVPRKNKHLIQLPGPSPLLPLGNLHQTLPLALQQISTWEFFNRLTDQYGRIYTVWFGPLPVVFISEPALIEDILVTKRDQFYKAHPTTALHPAFRHRKNIPHDPFITTGKQWQQARQGSPFSHERFLAYPRQRLPELSDRLKTAVADRFQGDQPDLHNAMERLSLDNFSILLIGQPMSDQVYHDFVRLCQGLVFRMANGLFFLPPVPDPRFYIARKRVLKALFDMMDQQVDDSFYQVMRQEMPQMDTDRLKEAMISGFIAGAFSVACVMVSLLTQCQRQPAMAERLTSTLKNLSTDINVDALISDVYLEQVLREVMRIEPPIPNWFRHSQKTGETTLGELVLPPNTAIALCADYAHTGADHWPDATTFQPERWTPEVMAANPYGSRHFFPFGMGPRACLGGEFGLLMVKMMAATILGHFQVDLPSTEAKKETMFLGARKKIGLRFSMMRR